MHTPQVLAIVYLTVSVTCDWALVAFGRTPAKTAILETIGATCWIALLVWGGFFG